VPLSNLIDDATRLLRDGIARHAPAAFASSFGAEDMVLLDLIARLELDVDVFTLDTGRLHEETRDLIARSGERYGRPIRILAPQAAALEEFTGRFGVNAFYRDIALRRQCCAIRKTEPLARALAGKALWITGLRREQSVTRAAVTPLEHDAANGLMKLSPLAEWTHEDVWDYLRQFDVPVNALHARGFPSIGCAPCTRAVQPGEDPRAGRWWWEHPATRECGLHIAADGRLVRGPAHPTIPIQQRSP